MASAFRICATCRHFEVLKQAREFPNIVDTEYIVFRCALLRAVQREDYLMAAVSDTLPVAAAEPCPHWVAPD